MKEIILGLVLSIIVLMFISDYNFKHKIIKLEKTLSEIITKIETNNKTKYLPQSFTITAYTTHKSETNNNPQLTAIMEKPISGKTCAVSRDYINWLGGRIYIETIGVRRVNDLMNKRFNNRIDLCVPTKKYAKKFGKQKLNVVFLGR